MNSHNKEIIALILAGGQGTRLKSLTTKSAKPAVPYGGKYKIIDFPLSNCSNSGIDTVGILTQYRPLTLNNHIGIGASWDLDRRSGGVTILPPYVNSEGGRWYRGTANAIFENIEYVDSYNPEYVLVLSGDHIYKMDYSKMLKFHKSQNANLTISVIEVPWEETHRFGILNTNPDNSIYEFDEKPVKAKNNKASMGIYIFNWSTLKQYLTSDEKDENSDNDFGKNIIPKMLEDKKKIFAYEFSGYWKDVGTVESLWQANMDLLKEDNELDLYNKDWKIYTKNPLSPPHYIGGKGRVFQSLINEGCEINGLVRNSVLFHDVIVEEDVEIFDSVIMPNVVVKKGSKIYKSIIMEDLVIEENMVIGKENGEEVTLINNSKNKYYE
jgi:glucose-1-phosphate adenylyltransferase